MKSSSASVGAMELSQMAKMLEAAGKEGDKEYIDSHMAEFMACCEKLIRAMDTYFKKDTEDEETKELSVLDNDWVYEMIQACDDMDSAKVSELILQVSAKRYSKEEKELITRVGEFIDQYDYDEAVELLKAWNAKSSGEMSSGIK